MWTGFWVLFVILFILFIGFLFRVNDPTDRWERVESIASSVFLSAVLSLILSFMVLILIRDNYFNTIETERMVLKEEIITLKDNVETKGSFFVGSGNINGQMKYYFMVKTVDGNIMKESPATNTYIQETNSDVGYHMTYKKYTTIDPKHKNNWYYTDKEKEARRYSKEILIVPNGTILHEYKIDLE